MKRFESFADAATYVKEHGKVGYQAPMTIMPGTLPASVEPDGRIKLTFFVPADAEWPAETYHRYAADGSDATENHFDRLRKPR